jgi:hypothetical protein
VRHRLPLWVILIVLVATATYAAVAFAGQDEPRDEAVLTVQVSSADHELLEGYFTLGDTATVMAKPGSDLFNFLARHRGRTIRVSLREAAKAELSRLER